MDCVYLLNLITKREMEKRKKELEGTVPLNIKTDRFVIRLLAAISILDTCLKNHLDIWDDSCKKCDVVKPYFRNLWLKRAYNLIQEIKPKFNYVSDDSNVKEIEEITESTRNKILKMKYNLPYNDILNRINFDVETAVSLPGFFESFYLMIFALNYLKQLQQTIEKFGISKEINTIDQLLRLYEKLFKKELIYSEGCVTVAGYLDFKEEMLM